jgi:hypothetical protein
LKVKLRRLISNEPRLAEQIEVYPLNDLGLKLYKANIGTPEIIFKDELSIALKQIASGIIVNKFPLPFLLSERMEVIDAWQ